MWLNCHLNVEQKLLYNIYKNFNYKYFVLQADILQPIKKLSKHQSTKKPKELVDIPTEEFSVSFDITDRLQTPTYPLHNIKPFVLEHLVPLGQSRLPHAHTLKFSIYATLSALLHRDHRCSRVIWELQLLIPLL